MDFFLDVLGCFGRYRDVLGHFGMFWDILGCFGTFLDVLGCFGTFLMFFDVLAFWAFLDVFFVNLYFLLYTVNYLLSTVYCLLCDPFPPDLQNIINLKPLELKFCEIVHPTPCVTCHLSRVNCHVSPVICHLSCVTCHMSHIFIFRFFFNIIFIFF